MKPKILLTLCLACGIYAAAQERSEIIREEKDVPPYVLPGILVTKDGHKITTVEEWETIRRPELLKLFEDQVYGKVPDTRVKVTHKLTRYNKDALSGKARIKEITFTVSNQALDLKFVMVIFLPEHANGKVPLFLCLNFTGNHTVSADTTISVTSAWVQNSTENGIFNNTATEKSRGTSASNYPIETILARGYGFATIYYGEVDPDFDDDFKNGLQPLFYKPGQVRPAPGEWGSIGAWAWSLGRAMDYFETDADIDARKIAVLGHSRLGKTALWAGALDQRFAMVISNNSGCGGAALSKRIFGEDVATINSVFPHWFCDNFNTYNHNEAALPVDQHELIGLIAPRPVYIASAEDDAWADPLGEYLSGYYGSEVYRLYGFKALENIRMPQTDQPVKQGFVGYHIRKGAHDLSGYDWMQYLDFADYHFKNHGHE